MWKQQNNNLSKKATWIRRKNKYKRENKRKVKDHKNMKIKEKNTKKGKSKKTGKISTKKWNTKIVQKNSVYNLVIRQTKKRKNKY